MRSLISTFRPQTWNLKAHMWYQLSPFPSSNVAFVMQQHSGNIHQFFATPRHSATPCYILIQLANVIDRCVQVPYQFTLEAPQFAVGQVYALIN